MSPPRVCFLMADDGHDPTETAVPFEAFEKAGFEIVFATENGEKPVCDRKMLSGITGALLGATSPAKAAYARMLLSPSYLAPTISWLSPSFSLTSFNLIFLPGGHEKSVRQVIDSAHIHSLLRAYMPLCTKPSNHSVAAICHGVLVLASAGVLKDLDTTTLPAEFEGVAYWGTRAFLGDYYKTYGAGSESCEEMVCKALGDRTKYKKSLAMGDFVVEDEKVNYLSGRFPGDARLLAERCVKMLEENVAATGAAPAT